MAASFAVFNALISRNVIATIASGLICLWLLQWLL
jgi:branched-subunit amino acid transport protein